jgi:hypothetical protein
MDHTWTREGVDRFLTSLHLRLAFRTVQEMAPDRLGLRHVQFTIEKKKQDYLIEVVSVLPYSRISHLFNPSQSLHRSAFGTIATTPTWPMGISPGTEARGSSVGLGWSVFWFVSG